MGQYFQWVNISNIFFSILSFIPQYLVITVSEIMVSVTGVEWAYTEAPPTMKARDSHVRSRRTCPRTVKNVLFLYPRLKLLWMLFGLWQHALEILSIWLSSLWRYSTMAHSLWAIVILSNPKHYFRCSSKNEMRRRNKIGSSHFRNAIQLVRRQNILWNIFYIIF